MKKSIKLYTRIGDGGKTSLVGGGRKFKSELIFGALGSVDELNANIGWCVAAVEQPVLNHKLEMINSVSHKVLEVGRRGEPKNRDLNYKEGQIVAELMRVQNVLLVIGAVLACSDRVELENSEVRWLERRIDYYQKNTRKDWYTKFLLPGGVELAARLDVTRTVVRRAEREVVRLGTGNWELGTNSELKMLSKGKVKLAVKYLNRLSDYLFALRCFVNMRGGYREVEFGGGA